MLSEWKIWDFFRQRRGQFLQQDRHHAFYCYSDVITGILINELKQECPHSFRIIRPEEMTLAWIEQELLTPSLFSMFEEPWVCLVYEAQTLRAEVKAALLQYTPDESRPKMLLLFSETDRFWNDLGKSSDSFNCTSLLAPKFFEVDQLLTFMAEREGIVFDVEAQTTFLELVEHDPINFSRELKVLRSAFPEQMIHAEQVRDVIAPGRLDIFAMASKLSKKQFTNFFLELLQGPQDHEHLGDLFRFLVGHIVKLQDPLYVDKKNRPSRYDKEIKMLATRWKEREIQELLVFVYNTLNGIKQKDSLENKFRQAYLATMK